MIAEIVMDMSPAYVAGAVVYFSAAGMLLDAFHLVKIAGQALNKVPSDLVRHVGQ